MMTYFGNGTPGRTRPCTTNNSKYVNISQLAGLQFSQVSNKYDIFSCHKLLLLMAKTHRCIN